MKLVKRTEHLNVFDSGMFPAFDGDSGDTNWGPGNGECLRRMYVGFQRDMAVNEENNRVPAVIALFTVMYTSSGTNQHVLEWLETSRKYDGRRQIAQTFRDELMVAVGEGRIDIDAYPEMQKREDGTTYYVDTLDGK